MGRQSVKSVRSRESSAWLTCKMLTEDKAWTFEPEQFSDCTRVVTWADTDSSVRAIHKLTELGVKRFLRGPKPWMFHLTRLEGADKIGKYSHYFIASEGLFNVIHSSIVLADEGEDIDEYIDKTDKGIKESQGFVIENGLLAPNSVDRDELLEVLGRGLSITSGAADATIVKVDRI
jgi:hypothetical protein